MGGEVVDPVTIKSILIGWFVFISFVRIAISGTKREMKFTGGGAVASVVINGLIIWGVASL